MTTKEAIQTMLDGYKLTAETWGVHEFVYFDGECFREENHTPVPLSDISDMSGILKIYKGPKPKQTVIIEKWLCKSLILDKSYFFEVSTSNIDSYFYDWNDSATQKVKLLDTYEVEL